MRPGRGRTTVLQKGLVRGLSLPPASSISLCASRHQNPRPLFLFPLWFTRANSDAITTTGRKPIGLARMLSSSTANGRAGRAP